MNSPPDQEESLRLHEEFFKQRLHAQLAEAYGAGPSAPLMEADAWQKTLLVYRHHAEIYPSPHVPVLRRDLMEMLDRLRTALALAEALPDMQAQLDSLARDGHRRDEEVRAVQERGAELMDQSARLSAAFLRDLEALPRVQTERGEMVSERALQALIACVRESAAEPAS